MSNKAKVVVLKICCQAVGFLLATSVVQQGRQSDTFGAMLALGEGKRNSDLGLGDCCSPAQSSHLAYWECWGARDGDRAGRDTWDKLGFGTEMPLQAEAHICSSVALVWFSERSAVMLLAGCPHFIKKKILSC